MNPEIAGCLKWHGRLAHVWDLENTGGLPVPLMRHQSATTSGIRGEWFWRRKIFARTMATTSLRGFMGDVVGVQVRQSRQVLAAFFGISPNNFQVRLKFELFFFAFRMNNEMQIWIDRHRVGISKNGAQLRQISDLIFLNLQPVSRLSNWIDRQTVV